MLMTNMKIKLNYIGPFTHVLGSFLKKKWNFKSSRIIFLIGKISIWCQMFVRCLLSKILKISRLYSNLFRMFWCYVGLAVPNSLFSLFWSKICQTLYQITRRVQQNPNMMIKSRSYHLVFMFRNLPEAELPENGTSLFPYGINTNLVS